VRHRPRLLLLPASWFSSTRRRAVSKRGRHRATRCRGVSRRGGSAVRAAAAVRRRRWRARDAGRQHQRGGHAAGHL